MATRYGTAEVSLPSDTEILIVRRFEAPRPLVWDLVTTPRHVLRWWGPPWCPLESAEIDLRVGGSWRYVARDESGAALAWHGTYREIVPVERIVSTEVFEDYPEAATVTTATITETDGVTTISTLVEHSTREHRDGHLAANMEKGMQAGYDRLDDLLAAADTQAERFRRVAGRFTDVAANVPPDAWGNPSPCDGWDAREVIRHMVEWMPSFLERAGVVVPDGPSVDDDPVGAWATLATALQAALDDPAAASREFDAGPPGMMTVEAAIGMVILGDVVIHTWDLARATGGDETLDVVIVAEMLTGMEPMDEMLRASGHYGPRVEVPADADVQTKLLAFSGRHP